MTWRDQLAILLGAASPFALGVEDAAAIDLRLPDPDLRFRPPEAQKDLLVFRDPAERERLLLFADHRSHSSHSSHSSHRSHYSGSSGHSSHSSHYSGSGGYVAPAPIAPVRAAPAPRPPAPVRPLRLAPPPPAAVYDPDPVTAGPAPDPDPIRRSSQRLTGGEIGDMVTKVQVALIVRGYKVGGVDGRMGPRTKAALMSFQAANNLPATGQMDLQTLRLLGVDIGMPSLSAPPPEPTAATPAAPVWLRRPTEDDLARYYPDRARRMGVGGEVVVSCTVGEAGLLEGCVVTSETPGDQDFGSAALRLARLYRVSTASTAVGSSLSLPFVFRPPTL